MKRFKVILALVFILISAQTFSQLKDYSNFSLLENGEIVWKRVYNRPGMSLDSIKSLIHKNVIASSSMRIIQIEDDKIIVELKEIVFEKNGDLFSGSLDFSLKEGRYRVALSGIRRYLGSTRKSLMTLTGTSPDASGYRLEDTYVNNKGNSLTGKGGLDYYNSLFEKRFDFKLISEMKDDW